MRDKDPIDGHERLPLFAEDSNRSLKSVPTLPDLRLQLGRGYRTLICILPMLGCLQWDAVGQFVVDNFEVRLSTMHVREVV